MTKSVTWRKSTFSNGQGGDCVELADLGETIGMRDSKLGETSPVLNLTRDSLRGLIAGVKAGEFDDMV